MIMIMTIIMIIIMIIMMIMITTVTIITTIFITQIMITITIIIIRSRNIALTKKVLQINTRRKRGDKPLNASIPYHNKITQMTIMDNKKTVMKIKRTVSQLKTMEIVTFTNSTC